VSSTARSRNVALGNNHRDIDNPRHYTLNRAPIYLAFDPDFIRTSRLALLIAAFNIGTQKTGFRSTRTHFEIVDSHSTIAPLPYSESPGCTLNERRKLALGYRYFGHRDEFLSHLPSVKPILLMDHKI